MENYCRVGQATDDNIANEHWLLDTKCYTHTHSEYVIFIAFPRQQYLLERASILLYIRVFNACCYSVFLEKCLSVRTNCDEFGFITSVTMKVTVF